MYPNFLHPFITEPTRLIKKQKPSLTDNILVNFFNKKIISGNLFDKISDHLANFLVIKDINNEQTQRKVKIQDMKIFNQDKYLKDLKEIENLNILQYTTRSSQTSIKERAKIKIKTKDYQKYIKIQSRRKMNFTGNT